MVLSINISSNRAIGTDPGIISLLKGQKREVRAGKLFLLKKNLPKLT
jgi:hypothetical protein